MGGPGEAAAASTSPAPCLLLDCYKLMLDLVMTSGWTSRLELDLLITSLTLMDDGRTHDGRTRPKVGL